MALTWSQISYLRTKLLRFGFSRKFVLDLDVAGVNFSTCGCTLTKVLDSTCDKETSLVVKKKDVLGPLPKAYTPEYVESGWYEWWEANGFFSPEYQRDEVSSQPTSQRKKFVVCLPPPNVTGTLHLGHALGNSIQDALARWHRMHGHETLWNPGADHAGIATQVVVEKQLWREQGLTRHDIGPEKFLERVWKWKEQKGETIYHQMKRLGSSLDWDRACFTLDPKLSRAVNEAFIRLHDQGLVYRSKRLVNWSCALKSAISDVEVENMELEGSTYLSVPGYEEKVQFGVLTTIRYPIKDSNDSVSIATTRPETMLGDVAIAIHPDDPRYNHLHGNHVVHPLTGQVLPIIMDEFVEQDFGTGIVKITPGHDTNDYEVGKRHSLESLEILTEEGNLTNVPDDFMGMPRFIAREKVLEILQDKGLIVDHRDHKMALPLCSRSQDVIEPVLKHQWFVECQEMAQKAVQAVRSGDLELVPGRFDKQWYDWLENIQDWCVSRQLWWGHRIPAYMVLRKQTQEELLWVSGHSLEEATQKAVDKLNLGHDDLMLIQDEDVLDTWFSSALFPFSIFGWPDKTSDLARFYPTSLLETASDIMFFWVARMVMLGEKLTGQLPFNKVLFHSILRDAHGRKMSKSLGNIIDPMDVIHGISLQNLQDQLDSSLLPKDEISKAKQALVKDFPNGIPECGADALRFTLCSYHYKAQFINIDVNQIINSRHFCNKMWQAYKFVSSVIGDSFVSQPLQEIEPESATDAWILSRLSAMVVACQDSFETHELYSATSALTQFWWFDFCDVYLESSKPVLQEGTDKQIATVRQILYTCVETGLRALSPFMPYLTEELYQRLPGDKEVSISVASYPTPAEFPWYDEYLDQEMTIVRNTVSNLMALRKDFNLTKYRAKVYILVSSADVERVLGRHLVALQWLSRSGLITFVSEESEVPVGCVHTETPHATTFMQLQEGFDGAKEQERIEKQMVKLERERERFLKQTDTSRGVPEHIAQAALHKVTDIDNKLERFLRTLKMLEAFK